MQQENDEIANRNDDRRTARYCRQLSYQIRKIRQNDPSIVSIQVGIDDVIPSLMKALEHNHHVIELEISCIDLPIGGIFGKMIRTNFALQRVRLLSCQIPAFSAATVFRSLAENSSVQELDLSLSWGMFEGSTTGDSEDTTTPATIDALSKYLEGSTSLKTLNLRKTGIHSDQILKLFQSISCNNTLQTLDISENDGVGPAVVTSLIDHLPHLRLQVFNVELTGISECLDQQHETMRDLEVAMQSNTSLWKLTGIVLHQIDHYSIEDDKKTQRKCVGSFRAIEYYKIRNAIIGGNWLLVENILAWPKLLSDVVQSTDPFRNDLIFFLLQEKSSCLCNRHSVPILKHIQDASGTLLDDHKVRTIEKATTSRCSYQRKRGRGRRSSFGQPAAMKRSRPLSTYHNTLPSVTISGYDCPIHERSGRLPQGCCSFEQRKGKHHT